MGTFPLRSKVAVFDLISKHLKKSDSGLWVYDQHWSDSRVAVETGVKLHNVINIRSKEFGKIGVATVDGSVVAPKTKAYGALCHEVRLLTDNMARLASEVERLKRALGEA